MTDAPEDTSEGPLPAWSRVLVGVPGLGLAVSGLVGVFAKDTNVAGVPLLILSGAAFLYVSLTGQRLIQVSKDGVVFGKAARLERTLREATADPELSYSSKERIADIAEINGIRLPRPPESELKNRVRETFDRISDRYGFEIATRLEQHDSGTDFVLTNGANRTVAVEVKSQLRLRNFAAAIRKLRASSWDQKLLVTDGVVPEELASPYRSEEVWIVGTDPHDEAAFESTLRTMGFIGGQSP